MIKLYIYLGTFFKLELTWKNAIRVSDRVAAVVHLLYIDGQSLSHYKWRKLINSRNI